VTALRPTGSVPAALTALASIRLWAGFFGPIQVLLAQQAAEIAPVAPGRKEFVFGR